MAAGQDEGLTSASIYGALSSVLATAPAVLSGGRLSCGAGAGLTIVAVCRYALSPMPSRAWVSWARSAAALAPQWRGMSSEVQSSSSIRSPVSPPARFHWWAKLCRHRCAYTAGTPAAAPSRLSRIQFDRRLRLTDPVHRGAVDEPLVEPQPFGRRCARTSACRRIAAALMLVHRVDGDRVSIIQAWTASRWARVTAAGSSAAVSASGSGEYSPR